MTSILFSFFVFFAVIEMLLQLCWAKFYFSSGVHLRERLVEISSIPSNSLRKEPSYLLRDFDLKNVHVDELLMRQGKFGISSNIFFHGFIRVDRANGQIKINAYLDFNVIVFSMACGSWLVENEWLGIVSGGLICWIAARYFVDERLLTFVAERAYDKSHAEHE